MSPRWRLILAAAVFLGWIGYLAYAAAVKSHAPVVSHAQAAATRYQVVAEVKDGGEGKPSQFATVAESLTEGGPAAGTEIMVTNLPQARGYTGPGKYLLQVIPDAAVQFARTDGPRLPAFNIVGQQRSPGTDLTNVGPPLIYAWSDDVRKQAEKLSPKP